MNLIVTNLVVNCNLRCSFVTVNTIQEASNDYYLSSGSTTESRHFNCIVISIALSSESEVKLLVQFIYFVDVHHIQQICFISLPNKLDFTA